MDINWKMILASIIIIFIVFSLFGFFWRSERVEYSFDYVVDIQYENVGESTLYVPFPMDDINYSDDFFKNLTSSSQGIDWAIEDTEHGVALKLNGNNSTTITSSGQMRTSADYLSMCNNTESALHGDFWVYKTGNSNVSVCISFSVITRYIESNAFGIQTWTHGGGPTTIITTIQLEDGWQLVEGDGGIIIYN